MAVLRRRSRLINFRLTEQEYSEIKTACSSQGARCLSEFARTAVINLARSQPVPVISTQDQLMALNRKVTELGSTVGYVLDALRIKPENAVTNRQGDRDAV